MHLQLSDQNLSIHNVNSDNCSLNAMNRSRVSLEEIAQDSLLHITGFAQTNWNEGTALAKVSRIFKRAIDSSETRQLVHLFKQARMKSEDLSQPILPTDYLKNISFDALKALLPENLKFEKALSSLFQYASSIIPGSEIEKLTLLLMKHVDWRLEEAMQNEWPENSAIKPILKQLSNAFKSEHLNKIEWETYLPWGRKASFQNTHLLAKIADPRYNSIRPFVLEALRRDGMALQYAHEEFKKDKQLVLVAVKQNGLAAQFADASLQYDGEVGQAASNQLNLSIQEFTRSFLSRL